LGPLLVLTKADAVSRGLRAESWRKISRVLEAENERPLYFSAKTREGRETLWEAIRQGIQERNE
jgi:GTP-binding protein EngB required for normal cell division